MQPISLIISILCFGLSLLAYLNSAQSTKPIQDSEPTPEPEPISDTTPTDAEPPEYDTLDHSLIRSIDLATNTRVEEGTPEEALPAYGQKRVLERSPSHERVTAAVCSMMEEADENLREAYSGDPTGNIRVLHEPHVAVVLGEFARVLTDGLITTMKGHVTEELERYKRSLARGRNLHLDPHTAACNAVQKGIQNRRKELKKRGESLPMLHMRRSHNNLRRAL